MASKLSWTYDNHAGEERAEYRGLRIRAVRDDHPSNPFKDQDGHWPMLVRTGDRHSRNFDSYEGGDAYDNPIGIMTDEQLIHDQRALAEICGGYTSIGSLLNDYCSASELDEKYGEDVRPVYYRDADLLRQAMELAFYDHVFRGDKLTKIAEVLKIAGIRVYTTTVRGYCQGDWAEVLVIAPPAKIAEFGVCIPELEMDAKADPEILKRDLERRDDWVWDKVNERLMGGQADLYAAWAFGDVYGYVVEAPVRLPDPDDEPEWEEIEDGSCWGYYGTDHDESGLEEGAINAADCYLARQKRLRNDRLKALIINRVPLHRRKRILEEAL